jgi:hypothetical protein
LQIQWQLAAELLTTDSSVTVPGKHPEQTAGPYPPFPLPPWFGCLGSPSNVVQLVFSTLDEYKAHEVARCHPVGVASPAPRTFRCSNDHHRESNMADVEKSDINQSVHVADIAAIAGADNSSIKNKAIVNAAEDRNEFDHNLSIKDAVSYYRWAIFWCLMISMTVVMEGYDTILIGRT